MRLSGRHRHAVRADPRLSRILRPRHPPLRRAARACANPLLNSHAEKEASMSRLVMVLNGPNLNLLGQRQPEIYGYSTLADVERDCRTVARELDLELVLHQSNREYEIIDWIHEARRTAAGIV